MVKRFVLLALACSKSAAPPPLALPADTAMVMRAPGDKDFTLQYIEQMPQTPACVLALSKQVIEVDRVMRDLADTGNYLARVDASREDIEACAVSIGKRLGHTWEVNRDGALSEINGQWIGFADDHRVAWARTKDRVLDLLAPEKTLGPGDPLYALLPRLAPNDLSMIATFDLTSRAFGVPTRGEIESGRPPTIRLLCATPADALRLRAAFDTVLARPDTPPKVADLLRTLAPKVENDEVVVDVSQVFGSPDLPALVTWLTMVAN